METSNWHELGTFFPVDWLSQYLKMICRLLERKAVNNLTQLQTLRAKIIISTDVMPVGAIVTEQ